MMCIFHNWGRWRQYDERIAERQLTDKWALRAVTEIRQCRCCKKCGKIKDELIRTQY